MANTDSDDEKIGLWKEMWHTDNIGMFHKSEVHKMLEKHFPLLHQEGKEQKVFVPLCGKTKDMVWLSDQGLTVVGVDAVKKPLEDFFRELDLEWTEEDASAMGPGCKLLQDKNGKFRLYFGDILLFDKHVEGDFDCVWDRGSLVVMKRWDENKYTGLMKEILKQGGKILVEAIEYDKTDYEGMPRPPPAQPVFEADMKSLYGPECTVETVDMGSKMLKGKEIKLSYYLIVKI